MPRAGDTTTKQATLSRRRLIASGTGLAITSAAVVAGAPGAAAATGGGGGGHRGSLSVDDLAEIYQLKVQYAFGSDAIAAGQLTRGRDLYRATFSRDAEVLAGFDENAPDFIVYGPQELYEAVLAASAGAQGSQHLLGTIEISDGEDGDWSRRRTASIVAYVQATVVQKDGGLLRVLATYYDTAERRNRRWQLTRSFAQYLSIEVPAARLAPPAP